MLLLLATLFILCVIFPSLFIHTSFQCYSICFTLLWHAYLSLARTCMITTWMPGVMRGRADINFLGSGAIW